MKYVFVFPLFQGPYGGERHCLQLLNEIQQLGHTTELWTLKWNPVCDALVTQPLTKNILSGKKLPHAFEVLWSTRAIKKIRAALEKRYADETNIALIGMGWQSVYALAPLTKKFPTVLYYCLEPPRFLYDRAEQGGRMQKIFLKIWGPFLKKRDTKAVKSIPKILANSLWTQEQLQTIYKKTSTVVYPGIETERFTGKDKKSTRKKLSIPEEKKVILSVSKLHKRKNIAEAIEHFAEKEREKNSLFYIIGKGPEENMLKNLVRTLNLTEKIFFLGEQTDEQVADFMIAADEFYFFAQNEPFGIAPLEARLAGCTIVPEQKPLPSLTWKESAREFLEATHL